MTTWLVDSLGTTDVLAAIFDDEHLIAAMLEFEVALARAAAASGLIPSTAADAIARGAQRVDAGSVAPGIARAARQSGTPAIAFVKVLTDAVRAVDPAAAPFVHWGATSQDVTDTALVLQIKRARQAIGHDRARLSVGLRRLSDEHARTLMLARTLMQPAPPTTFGLKAAGWFAAETRSWRRLSAAVDDALVVQCGGASGTMAAWGAHGPAVCRAVAATLDLGEPVAPWHAHRDRLAGMIAACGVYTGALGKVARDVALLMQVEVGEAAEPGGGSSTMPHKRNPSGASVALAAAHRVPGLVAAFLSGMVQEHERGVGGIQAEWPTVAATVQATGAAAGAMANAVSGLTVNATRMRANLDATHGVVFAERLSMLLAMRADRATGHDLLAAAARESAATGRMFADVVRGTPAIADLLTEDELRDFDLPEDYLGSAETLRRRLLEEK